MKIFKLMIGLMLFACSANLLAYGGGGGGTKTCKKPRFSEFKPAHLAEVGPASKFSFLASVSTNPDSIKVSVKKLPVEVTINKVATGYAVSGELPAALQGTYARVDIKATATNKCTGNDGWLVKITGATP